MKRLTITTKIFIAIFLISVLFAAIQWKMTEKRASAMILKNSYHELQLEASNQGLLINTEMKVAFESLHGLNNIFESYNYIDIDKRRETI
ncbi:MAG: hypothetical protein IPO21_15655 [Bacteroidales bacterium]|nr:hypothetical protein [Bacteroidales bacterium]